MHSISSRLAAVLWVVLAIASSAAQAAGDPTFGQAPTFSTDVGFQFALSPDKKAFTASFSGLTVGIDGKSSQPVATRVFSFVLPLSGADPGTEVPIFVSGFVAAENGANGHLVFTVNDQSLTADFAGAAKNDFVQQLKYKVGYGPEVRLTVFLLADHDSKSDAGVFLNVTAIDTDLAKHPNN